MTESAKHPAVALVDTWLADRSGYDRRVWPRLAKSIERHRLSRRRRLGGTCRR